MEIKSYKKIKNNIYEIKFTSGETTNLYDNIILKHNLLINKIINEKQYNEIIKENNELEAYYLSLKYLNIKLRCESEINKYLTNKKYSKEIIENTINKLKKEKYLNREIYLKSYINDKINLSLDGPNKIRKKLNTLGFSNEEIDQYLKIDNEERIIKIIDKKVKTNNRLSKNMLKINISNYLLNQGYNKQDFIKYLDNIEVDNKRYIEKEYNKLINKYKNKYEDNNKLKYIIKNKLYQKGFTEEDIGEILNENIL